MEADKWLGTRELAEVWQCSRPTVRRWVASLGIPHRKKPGGAVQVRESVALAWEKKLEEETSK